MRLLLGGYSKESSELGRAIKLKIILDKAKECSVPYETVVVMEGDHAFVGIIIEQQNAHPDLLSITRGVFRGAGIKEVD